MITLERLQEIETDATRFINEGECIEKLTSGELLQLARIAMAACAVIDAGYASDVEWLDSWWREEFTEDGKRCFDCMVALARALEGES
jgi:hypothetical protein